MQTAREIREKGGDALPVVADISNEKSAATLIERTISAFGRIDVLV